MPEILSSFLVPPAPLICPPNLPLPRQEGRCANEKHFLLFVFISCLRMWPESTSVLKVIWAWRGFSFSPWKNAPLPSGLRGGDKPAAKGTDVF